jgi:hypothetical protein
VPRRAEIVGTDLGRPPADGDDVAWDMVAIAQTPTMNPPLVHVQAKQGTEVPSRKPACSEYLTGYGRPYCRSDVSGQVPRAQDCFTQGIMTS